MTLDRWDPRPPYKKLAQVFSDMIESGELRPGDQLPSEQELILEYGLSRGTIRHAMKLLREQGLVMTIPGEGTFVPPEGMDARG